MMDLLLSAAGRPPKELDRFNISWRTPLITAVCADQLDQARLLLDAGANPNAQYEFMGKKSAALHGAISVGMVNLLVTVGADLEARNADMLTPLLSMAQEGWVDAFDALLAAGANRAATVTDNVSRMSKLADLTGYNALHLTVMNNHPGCPAMVVRLLDLGFSPLALTPAGDSALDLARISVTQGQPAVLLGLLENWLLRRDMTLSEGLDRVAQEGRPRL